MPPELEGTEHLNNQEQLNPSKSEEIFGKIGNEDKRTELKSLLEDSSLNLGQLFENSFRNSSEKNLFIRNINEGEILQIKNLVVERVLKKTPTEQRQEIINRIHEKWPNDDKINSTLAENMPGGFYVPNNIIDSNLNRTFNNEVNSQRNGEKESEKNKEATNLKEEMGKIMEARKALLQGHEEVEEKINKKTEEIKKNIQLPKETKDQLQAKGYDKTFIDNYILAKVTLSEVQKDSSFDTAKVKEFEGLVGDLDKSLDDFKLSNLDIFIKNIDNNCNVADTSLDKFSSNDVGNTRRELFHESIGNQDLIDLKDSNVKKREVRDGDGKTEYDEMFPEEISEEEMVQTYGKFLAKGGKRYLDEYNKHLSDRTIDKYRETKECQLFLETIKNIKKSIENKTKDLVEELCIISQIKGMYMCMGEGNDFKANKANDIKSENGILTLNGHIDGIDFAIRQNTEDPNAHIETSTNLMEDNGGFLIGQKFKYSNYILPSQNQIFDLAKESVKSDGALDQAASPKEYVKLLQSKFMTRVDKMYKGTEHVHDYMEKQVKVEKIKDKTIKVLENIKGTELGSTINNSNEKLYDFVKMINFNIENSTDQEKIKLYEIIDRIQKITSLAKNDPNNEELNKYPEIIKNYLTGDNLHNTARLLNGGTTKGESVFDLFKNYENKTEAEGERTINFNALLNDLKCEKISDIALVREGKNEEKNADGELAENLNALSDNTDNSLA